MKTATTMMEPDEVYTYHATMNGKSDLEVTLLVNEHSKEVSRFGGSVYISKGFGAHPPRIVLSCPEGKTPEDFFDKHVASLFSLHEQ